MIANAPSKADMLDVAMPWVRKIAIYYARRCKQPAEDLAQEALMRIWRRLEQFDAARSSFKTWVSSEARGAMLDAMRHSYFLSGGSRKHRTERIKSMSAIGRANSAGDWKEMTFEDTPQRIWVFSDMAKALMRSCDKRERLLLILYYQEGLTLREVAEAIGLCHSRVDQMHQRLLKRLRATTLAA